LLQNEIKGRSLLSLFSFLILICVLVSGCQGDLFAETADLEDQEIDSQETNEAAFSSQEPPEASYKPPPDEIKFGKISVNQGLSQSSVSSIIQDNSGLLWFGTDDGLNKFNGYEFSIYKHDPENVNTISSNVILSIFQDSRDQLWIGTTEGLDRYNRANNEWQHFPLDQAQAIIEDSSGVIWVGSFAGLFHFIEGEEPGLVRHTPEITYALVEDSDGFLWVGTNQGLKKLDQDREEIAQYQKRGADENSLIDNHVRVIHEDTDGDLWVGTLGGLDRFDSASEIFTHFVHDELINSSISSDTIRAIYEDRSGVIWIGTDMGRSRRRCPTDPRCGRSRFGR